MNSEVCEFVSDLFYESRLHPTPKAKVSHLIVEGSQKKSGVFFIPVTHSGCNQGSQEEADRVALLLGDLIGKRAIIQGEERTLGLADILIVAPYNLQVDWIRRTCSRIPGIQEEELRVGTVDRFQGQEAAVVILSLGSSADAKSNRGVDFLLDLNRLNVALSRSQAASFVVGDESLADIRTLSPETAKVLNAYCKIVLRGNPWKGLETE